MKLKDILKGAAFFGGALFLGSCSRNYELYKETYQGYHALKEEAKYVYIFDDKSKWDRTGNPKFVFDGEPFLKDSLEIGKQYILFVEKESAVFPLSIVFSKTREILKAVSLEELEEFAKQN